MYALWPFTYNCQRDDQLDRAPLDSEISFLSHFSHRTNEQTHYTKAGQLGFAYPPVVLSRAKKIEDENPIF